MRRIWLISILGFVFLTMAACSSMYTSKGDRIYRVRGVVALYNQGKLIELQPGMTQMKTRTETENQMTDIVAPERALTPADYKYAITPATDLHGDIKPGSRVLIRYTEKGSGDYIQRTAVSIDAVWD